MPRFDYRQEVLIQELSGMLDKRRKFDLSATQTGTQKSQRLTLKLQEAEEVRALCEGLEVLLSPKNIWEDLVDASKRKERIPFELRKILETIKSTKEVITMKGKARLLLRHLLQARLFKVGLDITFANCLPVSQSFLSLAEKIDSISWELDTANSSWLDVTWRLACVENHLLVPVRDLGIFVSIAWGRAVITEVQKGSVAAEDSKICVGDILTHVNGESVLHLKQGEGSGKIKHLLSKYRGQPVTLTITKAWDRDKGAIFDPCLPLLQELSLDVDKIKLWWTKANSRGLRGARKGREETIRRRSDDITSEDELEFNPLEDDDVNEDEINCNVTEGYPCLYLGSLNLGNVGGMDQIEIGIMTVTRESPAGKGHPAVLSLREFEVCLMRFGTSEQVMRVNYPSIASCGRLTAHPNYFAFITMCQNGNNMCHVFYTNKERQLGSKEFIFFNISPTNMTLLNST